MFHRVAFLAVAVVLAVAVSSPVRAGIFANSVMTVQISPLTAVVVPPDAGRLSASALLDDGFDGHIVTMTSSIFQGVSLFGTNLLVAVPMVGNAQFTVANGAGRFRDGRMSNNPAANFAARTGFGGAAGINGSMVLSLNNVVLSTLRVPLFVVGAGGTSVLTQSGVNITVQGGQWNTAPAQVTGARSLFVNHTTTMGAANTIGKWLTYQGYGAQYLAYNPSTTVTQTGVNQLNSASTTGTVTLVAPFRVRTNTALGTIPGFAQLVLTVPEPAIFLQLSAVAGALAFIGFRRRGR